ncbi:MAG: tetratricopeptide repeat protein [Planctomycetes bacterium]|nr:tetratricopeptide repeat protein [Planctomycetota bacterium]
MGAADFVEKMNLTGPMFHNYDVGGYLMWRFHPHRLTFIDGRNFVHSAESYALYRDALVNAGAWARLIQLHSFGYAVIKHNSSPVGGLLVRLHKDPTWQIVFLDEVAAVFVKRDWVSQMPFLREEAESYDHLGQPVSQETNRPLFPHREIDAGRVLNLLGQRERAEAFFRAALAQCPNVAEARVDLGGLLMLRGARAEAEREFREALRLNPRLTSARYNLANLLAQGGQLDEAIAHYRRVLKQRPNFSSARNNLATALSTKRLIYDALAELRETLRLDPGYAPARHNLARMLIRLGDWAGAEAECQAALKQNPQDDIARALLDEIVRRTSPRTL